MTPEQVKEYYKTESTNRMLGPTLRMIGPAPKPLEASYKGTTGVSAQPYGPQNKPTTTTAPKAPSKPKAAPKPQKTTEEIYQENLRKEIENAYKQQIDFLSQQEQTLQGQLPGQIEQIGAQYEALRPGLETQLGLQQQAGEQAQEGIRGTTQENLAAIRRSGEEQGLRAVQQFGGVGGSSAAQAAGELIAREQLRAQGAAQMQQAQGIQNIQQQLRTIQAEYDSNVNKLNLEKERAVQTARNEFNRQLETIRSAKMQAGVTKANQTIQALQDFATRRRAIEDQATALQNNLTMMRAQAEQSANLARLSSSLQAPTVTPIAFSQLFPNNSGQSNEAAKTLQAAINSGRPLSSFGITPIGKDPITNEDLYQTSDLIIIDSKGNKRTGSGQQMEILKQLESQQPKNTSWFNWQ